MQSTLKMGNYAEHVVETESAAEPIGVKVQVIDSLRMTPGEAERIDLNLDDVAKIVNSFENPTIENDYLFRPGDFSKREQICSMTTATIRTYFEQSHCECVVASRGEASF